MSSSRRAFALSAATALSATRIMGANDRIRLGLLGSGGRGTGVTAQAKEFGGVDVAVICDVNQPRIDQAKQRLNPTADGATDYKAVLNRKDIDVVLIGSPDHWHVPMTIDAVAAGKDVYCEKPLTHTIAEGDKVIAAVEGSRRVVQVGYQQRSYPHIQQALDMIRAGRLGKVTLVQSYWYQNYARRRNPPVIDETKLDWKAWQGRGLNTELNASRLFQWRFYWDFGGGSLTDLFSHWCDTIQWIMDDYKPLSAVANGGKYVLTEWDCPDTISAAFTYPRSFTVTYDSTLVTSYEDGGMLFRGTGGALSLTRGGYQLYTEDSIAAQKTVRPAPTESEKSSRDGTIDHILNWLECVRSRKQPNSDVRTAVAAANTAHYGNLSYREGRRIEIR